MECPSFFVYNEKMKAINIYALTRIEDAAELERLERQMSKRRRRLRIRPWETEGLKDFMGCLSSVMPEALSLRFFYSFTMPKLGKEFDLLRVGTESIVNIELKSGNVTDEAIKKQLLKNRHYLATLGKDMYSYTFISRNLRLVRLSRGGRLVETAWEELSAQLAGQGEIFDGEIEDLFREERYLISPLTDVEKFLQREYFLTSQQTDIERRIIKQIRQKREQKAQPPVQGFTGLPGTGKTILLFDLAMRLSETEKVCVLHYGSRAAILQQLNTRLKRIDFYECEAGKTIEPTRDYAAILVDEGQRLDPKALSEIRSFAMLWHSPVIFSYDCEESIAPEERTKNGAVLIEQIPGYQGYRLTNRIRLNSQLSSFISRLMYLHGRVHRMEYPDVELYYANDEAEERILLSLCEKEGFVYIRNEGAPEDTGIGIREAAGQEFDRVVMLMDEEFYYDERGYLRQRSEGKRVRYLFRGLSRAKKKIAIVVRNNPGLFETVLYILQRGD